jgi:adenylate cyclase
MLRRTAIGLVIGVAAGLAAWFLGTRQFAQGFENDTYDWRLVHTANPADARQDIAVIEIDENSLRGLGKLFGRWPWPRVVHTGVIDFLTRSHAKLVVYDVLFTERDTRGTFPVGNTTLNGPDSDAALVSSVEKAGNVILLADATYETPDEPAADGTFPTLPGLIVAPGPGFEARPSLLLPFDELRAAALAIGHNMFVRDDDGRMRRNRPFIDAHGVAVPSLGVAAALAAMRPASADVHLTPNGDVLAIGSSLVPVLSDPVPPASAKDPPQPSKQALIHYRGSTVDADSRHLYPTYAFFDVLLDEDRAENGKTPEINPSVFRDKIVFVGTSAAGLGDMMSTPFGKPLAAGAEIHAAVADDVLSSRGMKRADARVDMLTIFGIGIATGVIATLLPVPWATGIAVALMAGFMVVVTRLVGAGLWVGSVTPLAAASLALFGGVAWQYFVEGREKRKVKGLFGRYVSKDVFNHLVADPSLAKLGGQRREMSVLFSDIRGFTTASEKSTPEAVVAMLNEYFTEMTAILFRHQGTLDKFVGDMVMGLFGAPVADPRHADHAVETAIEMVAGLARLNATWVAAGRPTLDIGIGINSGEMIAGNIGSETIMSYTVIGDAVNLGSRLESLNKNYGTHILISEATRDQLTIQVTTRRVDEVIVKGKTKPVVVYEVVT